MAAAALFVNRFRTTTFATFAMHDRTPLTVLYEDNHLLVVCKPAGLTTQGTAAGRTGLLDVARAYLKEKYDKPGNVFLGVVSRLDAPVTGVLVLARTSKAARRLTEQFRQGSVEKAYWALVEGHPEPAQDDCVDLIMKDERRQRMFVTRQQHPHAQQARLSYRVLTLLDRAALLEVRLETGRKHQIRVQLAHRGYPIVGDAKYGATSSFPAGIALHARRLTIQHPTRKTPLVVQAPCPDVWQRFGVKDEDYE